MSQVSRRRLVGAATAIAALWLPSAALPQSTKKVYRLAILELLSRAQVQPNYARLLAGLKELGYVEGENLIVDRRFADGHADRLASLAAELVRNRPDVIFAPYTPTARAARAVTTSIPIVIALASDPVASGLAESLAKPGTNVSGTSNIQTDVDPRRIQLLKELLPSLRKAALVHAGDRLGQIQVAAAQSAGKSLGMEVVSITASQPQEYRDGFAMAKTRHMEAMVIAENAQNGANSQLIIDLAAEHRIAAIYGSSGYANRGGLISYGANPSALFHRSAAYVDKIFKGANPATLPIEQPTQFELLVNQKTARALGIGIPKSLLLRADRVID